MSPISMRQLCRSVASCCLLLPLGCSAAGSGSSTIGSTDSTGGAGAAISAGGAAGTAGLAGLGAKPAIDPGSSSSAGGALITGVQMTNGPSTGCTKDQNILFLIDRSGSMQCNPPPTTTSIQCEFGAMRADPNMPSKLEIVEGALSTAFNQLLPTMMNQPITRAGLHYFSTDDMCAVNQVPLVPVTEVSQPFLDQMRMAMMQLIPNGTTPIVIGLTSMYQYIDAQMLTGDKHIILVTDGSDTCTNQQGIADLIGNVTPMALQKGIRTWVIGAPGSEGARSMLSHIAKAGGTAKPNCDVGTTPQTGNCHYDMTQGDFAMTFSKALAEILAAVTCGIR